MKKQQTQTHYDEANDVLYISFGEPRPSYSEDFAEGIYLRFDFENDELSGLTIMDFSKRRNELKNLNLPFGISENVDNFVH
ncbi:DUF2283 domain-containing protein [Sutcliffiella sp. NPDC057660]|uniref:DUF2283 domain-containing protein n=1 Tax=Sutcliffiella sp. NPDC057660 TaxID=3346199 RepID=UPI0036978974